MLPGFAVLIALVAGATATQSPYGGSVNDLKLKLMDIKQTVHSMRPTITMLGAYVDSLISNQENSILISVDDAREKIREMNVSEKCKQEAFDQLNEVQKTKTSNCSTMVIFEDAGDVTYNSADFIATSMMYYDEVSRGLSECQPWYEIWHSIPCFIRYIIDNIRHMKAISEKGFSTFKDDKAKVLNIIDQVKCTTTQIFSKSKTTTEILNGAYQCSNKSQ